MALLAGLALAASCVRDAKSSRGELIVALSTDMAVTKDMDEVRVEVLRADGIYVFDRQIPLLPAKPAPTGKPLPATLSILPSDSGGEAVHIRVTARRHDDKAGTVESRVVREAQVKVPTDRVAMLQMPLRWLCDGKVKAIGTDSYRSDCADGETCVAGTCERDDIDANALPDYAPGKVFGGGDEHGRGSQCLDVAECFTGQQILPLPTDGTCQVAVPAGADAASLNVAMVLLPGSDGHCLDDPQNGAAKGTCYLPLDSDPLEGFRVEQGQIILPEAVCHRPRVEGVAVSTSTAAKCPKKNLSIPVCGPWTGWDSNPVNATRTDGGASLTDVDSGRGGAVTDSGGIPAGGVGNSGNGGTLGRGGSDAGSAGVGIKGAAGAGNSAGTGEGGTSSAAGSGSGGGIGGKAPGTGGAVGSGGGTAVVVTSGTIGPQGGTLAASDGALEIAVPPDALLAATVLTIRPSSVTPAGALGTAFDVGPPGLLFRKPVTLIFQSFVATGGARVGEVVGGEIRPLAVSAADYSTVRAQTSFTSSYAVVGEPACTVNANCVAPYRCVGGACTLPCERSDDCPGWLSCQCGACLPLPCEGTQADEVCQQVFARTNAMDRTSHTVCSGRGVVPGFCEILDGPPKSTGAVCPFANGAHDAPPCPGDTPADYCGSCAPDSCATAGGTDAGISCGAGLTCVEGACYPDAAGCTCGTPGCPCSAQSTSCTASGSHFHTAFNQTAVTIPCTELDQDFTGLTGTAIIGGESRSTSQDFYIAVPVAASTLRNAALLRDYPISAWQENGPTSGIPLLGIRLHVVDQNNDIWFSCDPGTCDVPANDTVHRHFITQIYEEPSSPGTAAFRLSGSYRARVQDVGSYNGQAVTPGAYADAVGDWSIHVIVDDPVSPPGSGGSTGAGGSPGTGGGRSAGGATGAGGAAGTGAMTGAWAGTYQGTLATGGTAVSGQVTGTLTQNGTQVTGTMSFTQSVAPCSLLNMNVTGTSTSGGKVVNLALDDSSGAHVTVTGAQAGNSLSGNYASTPAKGSQCTGSSGTFTTTRGP